jgi:hypothetical protein
MESTRLIHPAEGEKRAEQRRDDCNELRVLMDRHALLSARLKALSDQFLAVRGEEHAGRAHEYWARMLPVLEEDTRLLERARTLGTDICDLSLQT